MWSPERTRRAALGFVLLAPLLLAGCTGFRPVYGEGGAIPAGLEFNYAKPGNRLEQVIIQDLVLRLGGGNNPGAPEIRISASSGERQLTLTGVAKPSTSHETTVTASYTVTTADGRQVMSGTRRASASFTTNGQVLADESAKKDAAERAAHEVAETIRLTILGKLASPAGATLGQ